MGEDWRQYPFELVPGDPQLVFPAAEANHRDCESDTWFLAGELTGESNRKFAFLTIFNKNRPGLALSRSSRARPIVADFYTLALFDLDNGTYGTYTDYDMPGTNMKGARARNCPWPTIIWTCPMTAARALRYGRPAAMSRTTWCPIRTT